MDRLIINSNTCENVSQRQMFTTCFWKFLHFDEKAFHKDFTNLPFFAGEGGKKTLTNQQKSQRIPNGHWHVLFIHEVKLCQKSGHIDNGFGFFAVFFLDFRWRQVQNLNDEFRRCPSIRVGGDSRELWCASRWCCFFMNPRPVNQRFFLHKTGGGFWKESCGFCWGVNWSFNVYFRDYRFPIPFFEKKKEKLETYSKSSVTALFLERSKSSTLILRVLLRL